MARSTSRYRRQDGHHISRLEIRAQAIQRSYAGVAHVQVDERPQLTIARADMVDQSAVPVISSSMDEAAMRNSRLPPANWRRASGMRTVTSALITTPPLRTDDESL
jgi:hypothetical protein